MHNHNIKFKETSKVLVEDGQKLARCGKGFIYRLLVSRASNTLCVRFQNLTKRIRGEYVIVCDRKIKRTENNSNIVRHTFNKHYYGYVIKLEDKANTDDEITQKNETITLLILNPVYRHNIKIKGNLKEFSTRRIFFLY